MINEFKREKKKIAKLQRSRSKVATDILRHLFKTYDELKELHPNFDEKIKVGYDLAIAAVKKFKAENEPFVSKILY